MRFSVEVVLSPGTKGTATARPPHSFTSVLPTMYFGSSGSVHVAS